MEDPVSVASFKKIAVVTGASSGIGAVYADRFAARELPPLKEDGADADDPRTLSFNIGITSCRSLT
jgi:hypothetical protein